MEGTPLVTFVGLCRPFGLPARWDFLRVDRDAFVTPSEPAAALASLRKRHADRELVDAHLAQPDVSGQRRLHPSLERPNAPFVRLRSPIDNQTIALMTASGCIGRERWPL